MARVLIKFPFKFELEAMAWRMLLLGDKRKRGMHMIQKGVYGWTSNLDVGNEKINDEHKAILSKMTRLEELNERSLDKSLLLGAYDDLVQFATKHFHEEEEYMRQINYPEAETHHRIHSSLLDALGKYRAEFVTSVYGRFPSAVFDFFKTWLVTHIMIVDKQYAEYLTRTKAS